MSKMNNIKLQEGITEVLDILNHMDNEYVDRIPKSFINYLKKNKLNDYKVDIDYSKSLEENSLKDKTRSLLAMIYMDYWCTKEEKKEFIKVLENNQKKKDELLKEKYNPDNLFKKKNM